MLDAQKLLIFFDFDGVIVQTFDVSYDMISHEYEGMSREEYRSYFEGNYYAEEEKRLGKHRVLNPISRKTWFEKWCVRILEKPIISGIDTVIKELAGSFDLEIVSGSAEFCIEAYLKQVGLREYFSEILGPEVAKSKVEKFTLACQKYGCKPSETLLVTDTLGDLREAEEVGVPSIAVTWGYHSVETLRKGTSLAIVETPEELLEKIYGHFRTKMPE